MGRKEPPQTTKGYKMLHWPFENALSSIKADNGGELPEELLEEVEAAAAALGKPLEEVAYADSEFTDDDDELDRFEDFVRSLPRGKRANFPNISGAVNVSSFQGHKVLVINDHGMQKLWL